MNEKNPLGGFLTARSPLSPEETKNKLKEYHDHPSIELRNEIVEDNLRLVVKYASECARDWHCPIEDLIQEGSLALIKAVDDYDSEKNFAFSTLAMAYIKNAIFRYLGKYGKTIRIPPNLSSKMRLVEKKKEELVQALHRQPSDKEICDALADGTTERDLQRYRLYAVNVLSLDASSEDDGNGQSYEARFADPDADPHKNALENDRYDALLSALSQLDDKDREILVARHQEKPLTLTELGKRYGISPEAVRQRENRAIKALKEKLKEF